MARLDKDRQAELEPQRMEYAITEIKNLGYTVEVVDSRQIQFEFNGSTVSFYPYSGWATGKTIQDGRGIKNLLEQIK